MSEFAANEDDCDLLVIGSGAAGLAAALSAAVLGLKVTLVEKERHFGGTTAWSGGWMWVPGNPLAVAAGLGEASGAARLYLQHELGRHFEPERVDMFLAQAPRMVAFFIRETALSFVSGLTMPDFHHRTPGASRGGRTICAAPFDGRRLGRRIRDLRPAMPEISPFGLGIASGADLAHFINATSDPGSFLHVAKRLARHGVDLLIHRRAMHLVNGQALVGRLLKSADDRGVRLIHSAHCLELIRGAHGVSGARVCVAGQQRHITARRGIVLACGGFPHDMARSAALLGPGRHWAVAPRANSGDGLRLGEAAGGHVRGDLAAAAAWTPVSLVPRKDGSTGHFPHLVEPAKPGLIMVTRQGRRFANEADSAYDVMRALMDVTPEGQAPEAFLICDQKFITRYGLGRVRPFPFPNKPWQKNLYLKSAPDINGLALACGIDPASLIATVDAYNGPARTGTDPEFGRGASPLNRVQGEPLHKPNPNVAPLEYPPYHGVKVVAGSLGTFAGLATDACARVLDDHDVPIGGLYAVGNDMASIMGGLVPAGGITLGSAMTFGYIAARHAAGLSLNTGNEPDA